MKKKSSKKLPVGITFPLANGRYEIREAGEQSAADALTQLMREMDHTYRTVARIEMMLSTLHEKIDRLGAVPRDAEGIDREPFKRLGTLLTKRLDTHAGRFGEIERKFRDIEIKLDAVAQGNLTNHNRLNTVERQLPKKRKQYGR